jgi:hypothetical protein
MTLSFIFQGGLLYRGAKGCEDRKKGLPTLPVRVVGFVSRIFPSRQSESSGDHRLSLATWGERLILSLRVMLHRSVVVGASIGTVRLSRPISGTLPGHSVVTGAFQPYHDDVLPRPFARTGR